MPTFRFSIGSRVRFAAGTAVSHEVTFIVAARSFNEDFSGGTWNSYRLRAVKDTGEVVDSWLNEHELEEAS